MSDIDRYKPAFSHAIADAFYGLPRDEYRALLAEVRAEIDARLAAIAAEERSELLAMVNDYPED